MPPDEERRALRSSWSWAVCALTLAGCSNLQPDTCSLSVNEWSNTYEHHVPVFAKGKNGLHAITGQKKLAKDLAHPQDAQRRFDSNFWWRHAGMKAECGWYF